MKNDVHRWRGSHKKKGYHEKAWGTYEKLQVVEPWTVPHDLGGLAPT